jgi:hypothetical protein
MMEAPAILFLAGLGLGCVVTLAAVWAWAACWLPDAPGTYEGHVPPRPLPLPRHPE